MAEIEVLDIDLPRLDWELSWSTDSVATPSAELTHGVLTLSIGDHEVWGQDDGEWPWVDLLQWLGRSWAWLRGEEGLPAPLPSDAPSFRFLVEYLEHATRGQPQASRSRASMALWNFRETHDLSRALLGAEAPPILVWREGLLAHILTEENRFTARWSSIIRSITALGEAIAHRLQPIESSDERARAVIRAWRTRDQKPSSRWLAIARTGGASNLVPLSPKWSDVDLGEIETSPILAAARMTARLPATVAEAVLEQIYEVPYRQTPIAEIASAVAERASVASSDLPFEQAHAFAGAFRAYVGLKVEAPFDPDAWLASIGVLVKDIHLGQRSVEAIAVWGPRNGPAILVNRDGAAAAGARGRNASLAHEIGHLIIDRTSALPAAEVLGGRVDPEVEQRARAFAAEVLLPRSVAGARFSSVAHEAAARRAVNSLTTRYRVSREIVAWQARNSGSTLGAEVYEYLRSLVRHPDRF